MGKMGDDSAALIMSSSSAFAAHADGNDDATSGAPATGPCSDDEDESHLLDPSPFMKVFGRLKGQSASVNKRAAPKAAPKSTRAERRQKLLLLHRMRRRGAKGNAVPPRKRVQGILGRLRRRAATVLG